MLQVTWVFLVFYLRWAKNAVVVEVHDAIIYVLIESLEDSCSGDRCTRYSTELTRCMRPIKITLNLIWFMISWTLTLLATLQHLIHPVVLERIRVRIKALWLGNNLNLLVVVRCSTIRANDSLFKVCVLEVSARVLDYRLILSLLAGLASASFLGRWIWFNDLWTNVTDLLESTSVCTSSSLRLNSVKIASGLSSCKFANSRVSWISKRPATSNLLDRALLGVLETDLVMFRLLITAPASTLSALATHLNLGDAIFALPWLLSHLLNAPSLLILTRVVLVLVVFILS